MSSNKNINQSTLLEEALLYKSLEEQGGEVPADFGLPAPTPREDWLRQEAEGDIILYGLLLSTEQNENRWAEVRRKSLPDDEYFREMDQYDLARWGLPKAIEKRRRELAEKQRRP